MRNWTKTAGLLFLAASSVYTGQALLESTAKAADGSGSAAPGRTDVKLLDETAGPAAAAVAPTTAPSGGQSVSGTQVTVNDAGMVEILQVSDTNVVDVLRILSLQSRKNIIASKEVRGTVTVSLYNVTIREALDAILKTNGYAYREQGNFIHVMTAKEMLELEKNERKLVMETFRLHYTPAANAVTMIKPALSAESQVSFSAPALGGIETGTKDVGGNSHAEDDIIIVRDYAENIDRVRNILKEVDRRPQQILMEATIVSAALSDDNALGVDFSILGGVDFASVTNAAGQFTGVQLPSTVSPNDGNVHSVSTGNNFTNGINGLKVGFVSSDVAVFLSALEQVTDTVVLANPKVLTLNKQKGEVLVGSEDGYLTTTVTESATVQTVEFLRTGTRLIFRPYIGDDGYIRMEVHPEDSDGSVKNGLPSKKTTEVTSNIMVKDGHTVVIGGLFRESSASSRSQIPVLGNVPLVGPLFRRQSDTTKREEIIILLTPHVIKDEQSYAALSEKELKDGEKLRVGVRRGMMPWGRERLAEGCYDCALSEMNKPNPNQKKAIWYLDCATNLNPQFLEAIDMKQRLTGREVTGVDNSSIRGFVRQAMLAERPAVPATQPVESPAVAPAAGPSAEVEMPAQEPLAEVPATQPVAEAPATQPLTEVPEAEGVAEIPATQPIAEAPATQPVAEVPAADAVAETPATQPVAEIPEAEGVAEIPASQPVAEIPATQPVAEVPSTQPVADEGHDGVTVTELPVEPIAGPQDDGDNK